MGAILCYCFNKEILRVWDQENYCKGTGSTILIFHTFIKHMDSNAQLTGQDGVGIEITA